MMARARRTRAGLRVKRGKALPVAAAGDEVSRADILFEIVMGPRSPRLNRRPSPSGVNKLPRSRVFGTGTACDACPVKGSGVSVRGGVAHVFLAVALCLPLVAAAAAIGASMAQDPSTLDRWLLSLLAIVFLAVVVWASLLPPVRQVEVSTARALLEYDEEWLPDVRSPR